jgi:hypothetical protein
METCFRGWKNEGRAAVTIRNYIDCPQKRALFWGYNDLLRGKNSDIGIKHGAWGVGLGVQGFSIADLKTKAQGLSNLDFRFWILDFGFKGFSNAECGNIKKKT